MKYYGKRVRFFITFARVLHCRVPFGKLAVRQVRERETVAVIKLNVNEATSSLQLANTGEVWNFIFS